MVIVTWTKNLFLRSPFPVSVVVASSYCSWTLVVHDAGNGYPLHHWCSHWTALFHDKTVGFCHHLAVVSLFSFGWHETPYVIQYTPRSWWKRRLQTSVFHFLLCSFYTCDFFKYCAGFHLISTCLMESNVEVYLRHAHLEYNNIYFMLWLLQSSDIMME